jgi:hypothetical protein
MVKKKGNKIGAWIFLIGIILAVIVGLFSTQIGANSQTLLLGVLVVLGIVIGLLNVGGKENTTFLLAGLSLVVVSFMGHAVLSIIPQIGQILSALMVLFVPATVVVALRIIFEAGKD